MWSLLVSSLKNFVVKLGNLPNNERVRSFVRSQKIVAFNWIIQIFPFQQCFAKRGNPKRKPKNKTLGQSGLAQCVPLRCAKHSLASTASALCYTKKQLIAICQIAFRWMMLRRLNIHSAKRESGWVLKFNNFLTRIFDWSYVSSFLPFVSYEKRSNQQLNVWFVLISESNSCWPSKLCTRAC